MINVEILEPEAIEVEVNPLGAVASGNGGDAGTSRHDLLANRAAPDQHPISAITDLQEALDALTNSIAAITIPTNVSDLNNDSEFLTLATLPKYNGSVSNGG